MHTHTQPASRPPVDLTSQRLRRLALLVVAAGVLAAAPRPSAAGNYYNETVARPIYRRTLSLPAGTYGFRTANLQPYAPWGCNYQDTVLVVTRPDGLEIANDNCFSGTKESCVTATSTSAGTWTLTAFAAPPPDLVIGGQSAQSTSATTAALPGPDPLYVSCGSMDVWSTSQTSGPLNAGVLYGGINLFPTIPSGQTFDLQTVHPPTGATQSVVLVYDRTTWQERGADFAFAGIGNTARVTNVALNNSRIVVGAYWAGSVGMTRVLANRCQRHPDEATNCGSYDTDGDRLANTLEAELGTSPTVFDTDQDGLFDYYEAIGRRSTSDEFELPKLGVSPRRRDLILEIEREQVDTTGYSPKQLEGLNDSANDGRCPSVAGTPLRNRRPLGDVPSDPKAMPSDPQAPRFSESAVYLRDLFADMPMLPANPDGSRIIAVHVDGGIACPGNPTLCGNWGGSNLLQKPLNWWTDLAQVRAHMSPLRHGLVKSVWYTCAGTGQGNLVWPANRGERVDVVGHELGHSFGIPHWGSGLQQESKGAYPSTMNYLSSYSYGTWGAQDPMDTDQFPWLGRGRWSEGRLPPLNAPSELGYSAGIPSLHTFFFEASYTNYRYARNGDDWDFNRDGRMGGPATTVLVDTSPLLKEYTHFWPDALRAVGADGDLPLGIPGVCAPGADGACHPSGGGALAAVPVDADGSGRVSNVYAYVPYLHADDGRYYPDQASLTEDVDNTTVTAWSTFSRGVSFAGSAKGEAAAATTVVGTSPRVLLLFPDYTGRLNFRHFNPKSPGTAPWQPIPNWPAGVNARHASIATTGAAWGGNVVVMWQDMSAIDGSPNIWEAWFDPIAQSWTSPNLTPIVSYFTPGVAGGPDGNLYAVGLNKVSKQAQVYRRIAGGTWAAVAENGSTVTAPRFDSSVLTVDNALTGRLNLVFVPLRDGAGNVFSDGSAQMNVFYTTIGVADENPQTTWFYRRATQQGYVSPTTFQLTGWSLRLQGGIDRPQPGHSVAATRRWRDVSVLYSAINFNAVTLRTAKYVPYANGSVIGANGHTDHNDAGTIAANMCVSNWRLVYGDDANCYCASRSLCPSPAGKMPPAIGSGVCPAP